MSNLTLTNLCNQRKDNQLNNDPPTRFEILPLSPYIVSDTNTVARTQQELNMRRKVEILKYNKGASKGNKLTKKQILSNALKGSSSRAPCPSYSNIPFLSTASNIPGPPIYLVEDPDVPLYLFKSNTNAYAEQEKLDVKMWVTSITNNILCPTNFVATNIITFNIKPSIDTETSIFKYITPAFIRVTGSLSGVEAKNNHNSVLSINLKSSSINPLLTYNNLEVPNLNMGVNFIHPNNTDSNTNQKINLIIKHPNANDVVNNDSDNSNDNWPPFNFSYDLFIGHIEISNIDVSTRPGFTYKLNMRYNIEVTNTGQLYDNTTVSMFSNINTSFTPIATENCELAPGITIPTASFNTTFNRTT